MVVERSLYLVDYFFLRYEGPYFDVSWTRYIGIANAGNSNVKQDENSCRRKTKVSLTRIIHQRLFGL